MHTQTHIMHPVRSGYGTGPGLARTGISFDCYSYPWHFTLSVSLFVSLLLSLSSSQKKLLWFEIGSVKPVLCLLLY